MISLLISAGAAMLYAIGGLFMTQSQGLSQLIPTLAVYGLFLSGASLQTIAISRGNSMALAYMLILGLEAVVVMGIGVFVLKENYTFVKILGVFLVALGIVLLRSEGT
jgi:multidrug transporter EmrE-like cation transporter